jgi:uncharacterized phage protein gp47/JayE
VGDPNTRFDNDLEITVGVTTTLTDQLFSCQETGPVNVPAAQLSVITTPVTGFSAPTNPAAAVPGTNVESNFEFRQRRELELALKGSSTVDAIRADLLQTVDANGDPLFAFVAVLENDTDATVDGVPPHAFETLVIGGTSAEVAGAIYLAKPAGIQAFGDDSDVVLDSQNNPHTIGFTRPDDVEVNIGVVVSAIAGQFPGDVAVREAVVDYFEQHQSVGYDVIHAQYVRIVMDMPGVVDVVVTIAGNADPFSGAAANFVIASREIARLGDNAPDGVGVTVITVAGVP